MYITNVNSSLSSMLGWSLCITVATFFLYRSRPWVLSAPGGIRSFAFKYVPFWGAYSQYDGMCVQKVFADKIEADFG